MSISEACRAWLLAPISDQAGRLEALMATMREDLDQMRQSMSRIDTATTTIAGRLTDYNQQLADLRAKLPSAEDQAALDTITSGLAAEASVLESLGKPDTAS